MASVFDVVEQGPPIEVFALTKAFNEDSYGKKVNLGVGAYRTDEGKPWVLPVVRRTESQIACNEALNHEYITVTGNEVFTKAAVELLLGEDSPAIKEKRAFGCQTLSGTGALRLGAEFLARILHRTTFYVSTPTWENHNKVFTYAGFTHAKTYRYWDPNIRGINFEGMIADLEAAPEGSVIILHACAHNPTGCDPTQEQWKKIADVCEAKKLFPFFDSAYQGFASGDPIKDAFAVRYFVSRGFEMLCSQSFAKNFGLYSERIGNLTIVLNGTAKLPAVVSQVSLLIRGMYSNPPAYGSRIVGTILSDPALRAEWMTCIKAMSSRIIQMRKMLYDHLVALKTPGTWKHIIEQIGMFSYTGLNEEQSKRLVEEFHIYLLKSGRISMCGLNEKNVEYVAKAINTVLTAPK
ncbi:aspartate aminotransferase, cytoplasmic [Phlebotomus argentipes]|uniref:aspartate aminotransferase, cytoplasmic n=1 Tax=Phlebotomus argentipes TaxID=94469 RepID=UPI0028934EF7|nr:aspartate aminotransferase, cytoplasmic [Phlebotomus argentipes]XP_059612202.1 aspartate aminotransferase, cytoplasmic [Phlebotomus argentipes]